jgi:dihydrofolate reductase
VFVMSKLKVNITMSLDGYVAGPNQSVENPLGEGAFHLHDWALRTKTFRSLHGDTNGGETGINDDVLREAFENLGATIMGRHMFGPDRGPWGKDPWEGWWGDNPPYHHPVFVLTHQAREPLVMKGGTTFFFVTNGIESALMQARKMARGKDVGLGGGANVIQQYLGGWTDRRVGNSRRPAFARGRRTTLCKRRPAEGEPPADPRGRGIGGHSPQISRTQISE